VPNNPMRLQDTHYQSGEGRTIPCFSLSGARISDDNNVLYFGVHGSSVKIELCDDDRDSLIRLLQELKNVGPQQASRRVHHDRR